MLVPFLLACESAAPTPPAPGRPDVILIAHDSTRYDHTSLAGYPRDTTPALAAFAAQPGAVTYTRAYSPAAFSLPSYTSLLTGVHAHHHRVGLAESVVPEEMTTLAEMMVAYGYRAAGFTGGAHLSSATRLSQGFELWFDAFNLASMGPQVSRALRWMRRGRGVDEPALLLLHGYDAHRPYRTAPLIEEMYDPGYDGPVHTIPDLLSVQGLIRLAGGTYWSEHTGLIPPALPDRADHTAPSYVQLSPDAPHLDLAPADLDHIAAHYDAAIRGGDYHLGRFLAGLKAQGTFEDSLIIVLSDHGESLGEDGYFRNDPEVGDRLLHVPMVIKPPRAAGPARTFDGVVSTTGLLATVAELLEMAPPADVEVDSFAWTLAPGAIPDPDAVAISTSTARYAVRSADWLATAIHGSGEPLRWSLFDDGEGLAGDRAGQAPEALAALIGDEAQWPLSLRDADNPALFVLDPALRQRLSEGGYWVSGPEQEDGQ